MSLITSDEELKQRSAYLREHGIEQSGIRFVDAECPYCGVDLFVDWSYAGIIDTAEVDETCPACGRAVVLIIDWEPVYDCCKKEGDE